MQGDHIVSINGDKMDSWTDVVQTVQKNPEKKMNVVIDRDGKESTVQVVPEAVKADGKTLAVSDLIRQRKMIFEGYFIFRNDCGFNSRSDFNELAKKLSQDNFH
ncbi:hypothetical protein ACEQPO_13310 [Bacillus sp. SL00103]